MDTSHNAIENADSSFRTVKSGLLSLILFLFPLFFLPFTQEYYLTNKLYLLALAALALVAVSTLELLVTRRFVYKKNALDNAVLLTVVSIAISTFFVTPNFRQALLNPNFGLISIASLAVIYFYLSRDKSLFLSKNSSNIFESKFFYILSLSSIIVSIVSFVFFFTPFKDAQLSSTFTFLKGTNFNTVGNPLDLMIYLGFFAVYLFIILLNNNLEIEGAHSSIKEVHDPASGQTHKVYVQHSKRVYQFDTFFIINTICLIITLVTFSLTLYTVFKPLPTQDVGSQAQKISMFNSMTSYRLSWYAAINTLKSPISALVGNGVDNFSSVFTQSKDPTYNLSSTWQIQNYAVSRSTILHIFTETGLVGLFSFGLLFYLTLSHLLSHRLNKAERFTFLSIVTIFIVMLLMPPTLVTFFFLFVLLGFYSYQSLVHTHAKTYEAGSFLPLYILLLVGSVVGIAFSAYFLGRTYLAEYYFKKSLDGFAKNNGIELYNNQRNAISINPYIERYRISFSQTNLLFANTIASNATKDGASKINDKDRQDITQAIQAAIAEAKQAVALNPQKSISWENLAVIYRNVIAIAQGADVWTIAAYQRAIALDPQNPIYRLNLGSVYFSLGNYEDASRMFEQAVLLKPDWPNGHYNLAWAAARKQNFALAQQELEGVITLLDPAKDKNDLDKAKNDLETVKKALADAQAQQASQSAQVAGASTQAPSQPKLNLATPPAATIEPKLKLNKQSTPPRIPSPSVTPTETAPTPTP